MASAEKRLAARRRSLSTLRLSLETAERQAEEMRVGPDGEDVPKYPLASGIAERLRVKADEAAAELAELESA